MNKFLIEENKKGNGKHSLFELLFLENPNPVFIGNSAGKVIAVNDEAVKLTQYSEAEILAMEKIDFLFPEEELKKKPLQYKALFENKIIYRERKLRRKDGSDVWVSMKSKKLSTGNLISIMTDISDKKKYEEILDETTSALGTLIDLNSQDFIYFKDGDGRWLNANKTCLKLFELEAPDYIGKTNSYLAGESNFFKKTFEELEKDDERAWKEGNLLKNDIIISVPESEKKIFEVTRVPVFYKDGSRKGLTVFGREVTDERKRNEELRTKDEMYRSVLENAHEAIIITQKGIIKYANPIIEKITGYTSEEYLYNFFVDFVHPDDREKMIKYHLRLLNGEDDIPDLYQFRVVSKSGETLWLELKPVMIEWRGEPAGMSFIRDITEEKRITEELKENEERFRSIVESMEDGIFISNKEGKILFASKNFIEEKGYIEEELVGKNIFDFIYEEDKVFVYSKWLELLEDKTDPIEFRLMKKNGEPSWVRGRSSSIKKNDEVVSVVSVIIDIQERKDIEDKLRKSEVKFRRVIENAPVGITIVRGSEIVFLNPQFAKMLKCSDFREALGANLEDFVSPESNETFLKYIAELENPSVTKKTIEIKFVTKTGEIIECLTLGQRTEFNNEPSVQLYIYDITEKKKADMIVTQLTRAVEQTSTMIIITDTNGKIEYANQALFNETGYSKKETLGNKPNLFKTGKNPPELYEDLWSTIQEGNDWNGEIINKRKDGTTYWAWLTVSPIKNNEGKIINFVALSENISKQKEIESALKSAKEKAELSDKLKSEFIAQVSHELRTPINSIVNFIGLLKHEFVNPDAEPGTLSEFLSYIENGSKRLVRTMELFLNMADVQSGSFEPHFRKFDLEREILSTKLYDHKFEAEKKKLEFKVNKRTNDFTVIADDFSLTHIFDHIIDNAIKYTKKGGINIDIYRNDQNKLIVEIADTGIGIEKEYLPKIFDLFSQEDSGYTRKFDGNGLGLTLTKYFCDINKIDINISSEKNIGTVVTLTLN